MRKWQHSNNRPMMRIKPGDLNDIARKRAGKCAVLDADEFGQIKRSGVCSGKLIRQRGGVQTYSYS